VKKTSDGNVSDDDIEKRMIEFLKARSKRDKND
jgi:hypothetical protein